MRVAYGLGNRLLHHIEPFQFIDSPEWYMMQNASPKDVKAAKPQVKDMTSFLSLFRSNVLLGKFRPSPGLLAYYTVSFPARLRDIQFQLFVRREYRAVRYINKATG